jgi:diguanylate cyclase (GGDEF)-like protein
MPFELAPVMSAIAELGTRLNTAYRELRLSLDHQKDLAESLQDSVNTRERIIGERTEQLRQLNAELDKRARTDELTGCLNYRGFSEVALRLCSETSSAGQSLSALALDIDLFKAFNDRYGHLAGDSALRRFAGAVRAALYRPEDVVGRPGGEEFIVLLPGATREEAVSAAHRIQESLRRTGIVHADSPTGFLTVSIGVNSRGPGADCQAMLAGADAALYRAKQNRNCVSD